MRYRNVDNWTNINSMKGLLFFIQRLDELTFPYTLDSYKAPTISLQGLIKEGAGILLEAINIKGDNSDKAISSYGNVSEEIRLRLKGNWIAKAVCSISISELDSLVSENHKPEEIIRKLDIMLAELDVEAYIAEIAQEVINLSNDSRQKKKLEFFAREFASFIQDRGVSRDHINNSLVEFFYGAMKIYDPLQFKLFCQNVYPHGHKFSVFVGVSEIFLSFDEDVLENHSMEIFDDESEESPSKEVNKFIVDYGLGTVLFIKVIATDYNSALAAALSKLDFVCNFYKMFSHKDEVQVSPFALVEQGCCEGVLKKIDAPKNNMHFIRDMRRVKATSTLKRYNDHITLDIGRDKRKFRNIINIHGMILDTKSEDIQLVNLWTCLETIAPGNLSSSKISNVVNRVIPILMLGYFNRLVVNLLFDILRWDRRSLTLSLKMAKLSPGLDLKQRFVALLVDPDNQSALSDLYGRCRNFELLRFRISTIAELLKDTKKRKKSWKAMKQWCDGSCTASIVCAIELSMPAKAQYSRII